MIDNGILNTLANQSRASNRLIKKRTEVKRNATAQLKSQVNFKHCKPITSGRSIQKNEKSLKQLHSQSSVNFISTPEINPQIMRRRDETKGYKGDSSLTVHGPEGRQRLENNSPRANPEIGWTGESD